MENDDEVFSRSLIKKVVPFLLIGIAASAGLLLFADLGAITSSLRAAAGQRIFLGVAMVLLSFALRAARWHYYLTLIGSGIGFWEGLPVFLVGFAAGVTPGKVGEIVKSLLLKEKWGTPVARSAPIVVAERVSDLIAVLMLCAIGLLEIDRMVVIALLALAAAIGIMGLCGARSLGDPLIRSLSKLPLLAKRSQKLSVAYGSFLQVVGWVPMTTATLLSLAAWSCVGTGLWFVATAFPAVHITFSGALVATCAPLLAGALALIPGGLGATEASMTGILVLLGGGTTRSLAVAITMLFRVISFWLAVGIGLLAMAAWRRAPHERVSGVQAVGPGMLDAASSTKR